MRKRLIPFIIFDVLVVGAVGGYLFLRNTRSNDALVCNPYDALPTTTISSDKALIRAEVAENGEEKARGLSGRNCLDPDTGMLFTYGLSGDYCFWMKDMKFAIDMVWLDEDKKIVTIKDGVTPDTYPSSFCPDKPAQYIIEVAAGSAAAYEWKVGTTLSF